MPLLSIRSCRHCRTVRSHFPIILATDELAEVAFAPTVASDTIKAGNIDEPIEAAFEELPEVKGVGEVAVEEAIERIIHDRI